MYIVLIAKPGHTDTGVGRYTVELERQLRALGHYVIMVHPMVPLPSWLLRVLQRWPGWDLEAFFENYAIWARYPKADIYHIISQNLASLMLFCPPPGKTVITVHDILPHVLRNDTSVSNFNHIADRIFDRLAMWGIQRIHTLLVVSTYTAQMLTEHLGIASDRIFITWAGVTTAPLDEPTWKDRSAWDSELEGAHMGVELEHAYATDEDSKLEIGMELERIRAVDEV